MDNRLFFPATQRNRDCIGDVLSRIIKKNSSILEIGSGSGEHGVAFQKRFPEIVWQTSDPELIHRKSIISWIKYEELNNKMPQPITLNVENIPWKIPLKFVNSLQGIVSINMIHVANGLVQLLSSEVRTITNKIFDSMVHLNLYTYKSK